jgi:predicted NUDIX family NTP pyrophosphohydrolase
VECSTAKNIKALEGLVKQWVDDGADGSVVCERLGEFVEELGRKPPATGTPIDLGEVTQSQAKRVHAWAIEAEIDVSTMQSNTFEMEWPPRSGRRQRFPEIDEAAWFDVETARKKLLRAQRAFIDRLERHLAGSQARPAHLGS